MNTKEENKKLKKYAVIAIIVALLLGVLHYYQGFHPYYIVIAANIEFFCIFYVLYLPMKVKRAREKQERKKQK